MSSRDEEKCAFKKEFAFSSVAWTIDPLLSLVCCNLNATHINDGCARILQRKAEKHPILVLVRTEASEKRKSAER
jgi:hypothetical protein